MTFDPRSVAVVPVWYATDRKPTGLSDPNKFFSGDRHDLSYGVAAITIPIDRHRMGELEKPNFWRLEFYEDPTRHVVLHSVTPKRETDFFHGLRRRIDRTNEKHAFVFIHGYNVHFKDAARRAGQMAWDLNFDGAAILYSWPSQARARAYGVDSNNAEWTTPHLEYFLSRVSEKSGARTIHLIAHSMGNRPLISALRHFSRGSAVFHEIALAAPDIDADVFMKLADEMRWAGQRVTLYASDKDRALRLSKRFNGYPRAGDVADLITIVDGIDTVDASAVDTSFMGHSYYGGSRSVLSDIFYLLRGIKVSSRAGIRPSIDGRYWLFRP
jgi:esterase/lipase superfamily enzyme